MYYYRYDCKKSSYTAERVYRKNGSWAYPGLAEIWEQRVGDLFWRCWEGASLPGNLERILNRRCPFAGDARVKIKDAHMLVLVPANVGGEALTLNRLKQLIKSPLKSGHATSYECLREAIRTTYGSRETGESYWILMTRDVIPGSRNKVYSEQTELVQREKGYTLPSVREAAICILMECVVSATNLFENRCHIRCTETIIDKNDDTGVYTVTVGGVATLASRSTSVIIFSVVPQ